MTSNRIGETLEDPNLKSYFVEGATSELLSQAANIVLVEQDFSGWTDV